MPPVYRLLGCRVLVLAWLITWATAFPLFHVHVPDTTDRWSILQSGGAHTVFTPDLPGEYSHPFHDNQPEHSSHLSTRVVNSPELAIAATNETDDRKVKPLQVLSALYGLPDTIPLVSLFFTYLANPPYLLTFQAISATRAPPSVLPV
jgi:hypothetical protein